MQEVGAEEFRLGPQSQETSVVLGVMLGCPYISYLLGSPIRAQNHNHSPWGHKRSRMLIL